MVKAYFIPFAAYNFDNLQFIGFEVNRQFFDRPQNVRFALKASHGLYLSANGGGNDKLVVQGKAIGEWETFVAAQDGPLISGMSLNFRSYEGHYVSADTGGNRIYAHDENVGGATRFRIYKLGASEGSVISSGDRVALQAYNGSYLTGIPGQNTDVEVDRRAVGPWEAFVFQEL